MINLNWFGLITLIIGCGCFGVIGFRRSGWWGPAKRVTEDLNLTEKRLAKIGFVFLVASSGFFVIANL
jgi:hypothetical protein